MEIPNTIYLNGCIFAITPKRRTGELYDDMEVLRNSQLVVRDKNGVNRINEAVQNTPIQIVDVPKIDTLDVPNPNDIIQSVLSNVLQPFTAPEIAQKTDIIRNHASGYKSAKRAVSLEKALLIASKLGVGDVFVTRLSQAMRNHLLNL